MAEEWGYTGGNIQAAFGLSVSNDLWHSDNDDYEDYIMENEVSQLAVLR